MKVKDQCNNMNEHLSSKKPIARITHKCDYCAQSIPIGEQYELQTILCDGRIGTWKNHLYCQRLALVLDMFDDEEGLTGDDFREGIYEEYRKILFNQGKDPFENPTTPFKERLNLVLKHHGIEVTMIIK